MKFSKDPWTFSGEWPYGRDIHSAGDLWIGTAHGDYDKMHGFPSGPEECLANARLFAEAPNLLRACRKALKWGEEEIHWECKGDITKKAERLLELDFLREAIRKAEGD